MIYSQLYFILETKGFASGLHLTELNQPHAWLCSSAQKIATYSWKQGTEPPKKIKKWILHVCLQYKNNVILTKGVDTRTREAAEEKSSRRALCQHAHVRNTWGEISSPCTTGSQLRLLKNYKRRFTEKLW